MAAVTPRLSGLWADPTPSGSLRRMPSKVPSNYFSRAVADDDFDEEAGMLEEDNGFDEDDGFEEDDGRTPLDRTIDRIGMGSYQWTLLSLCGFGWMADNMWMQTVAIILPRVQQHYTISDGYIGVLSASTFAGMMFGAIGWGTCSDLMGRSTAFNATLFFTAVFGMLASFTTSFNSLCFLLFFLGSAVGGSMPTDGTLLLEHMPNGKQYLVTALSVFFSAGSVLSAIAALMILPQNSCQPGQLCDVDKDNRGWKYLLLSLGLITLILFLARMVFFTLHESPRYLVSAGRAQEALESLQMISRFNGDDLTLSIGDVQDNNPPSPSRNSSEQQSQKLKESSDGGGRLSADDAPPVSTTVFDAGLEDENYATHRTPLNSPPNDPGATQATSGQGPIKDYNATSSSTPPSLGGLAFTPYTGNTPAGELPPAFDGNTITEVLRSSTQVRPGSPTRSPSQSLRHSTASLPRPRARRRRLSTAQRVVSSVFESGLAKMIPRSIRSPLLAWLDKIAMVLSPEWVKTTLVVWAMWCTMALAYTMFNVFLPKLLEQQDESVVPEVGKAAVSGEKSLNESLWDMLIFTMGGCPGAIIGAYLVDTRLGRRWSLAGSTFITAFFCTIFVMAKSSWAVRMSTVGINLSATTMWAVLYGWTPEIFTTEVRGTACGIASALSRIGGMIAPLIGGFLLMINRSIPVYTSVVTFVVGGMCTLLLKETAPSGGGKKVIAH